MDNNPYKRQEKDSKLKMSSVAKWLFGDIGNDSDEIQSNLHKITYQAQVIP